MTRFWMRLVGVSLISAASVAGAQSAAAVAIPATPAGGALRAWYSAYNSGDSAAIQAFLTKYQSAIPSAVMLANRRNSGGLELIKVLVDQPRHIEFLAKQKSSDLNVRGTIEISDGEPGTLTQIGMRAIPPGAPLEGCKTYDPPPTTTNGAANPKDVASEDAILSALYDAISGPACQHRDWDRFKSLFVPGARLIPTGFPNGKATARVETPDEYANSAKVGLEENGFFEREIARPGETFGAISHAFSVYESRRQANDAKPFARGINSIQLLNDGTRWWILTVYWQSERPDSPIPEAYLKDRKP